MTSQSKRTLRTQYRKARRSLSTSAQQQHAAQLQQQVLGSRLTLRYQRFTLYQAADGEIDTAPLASKLLEFSKQIAYPCLRRDGYNASGKRTALRMHFAQCPANRRWITGEYGLLEPLAPTQPPRFNAQVVFLPLVAFDQTGARLGMGGGFYDRLNAARALRIGLAHAQQQSANLPVDEWDLPLDAVITERAILTFNPRARTLLLN